ncbi:MAG: hypothetical protein V5A55_01655 [Halovenus sp.]
MSAEPPDHGRDRHPAVRGAVYGAGAFVSGYLVTLLLVVVEGVEQERIEFAGWLYYNAQFVDVEFGETGLAVNYVRTEWGAAVPALVYHLVPAVVLLATGFLLASRVGASGTAEGAATGASIVVGTVILAGLGTVLFSTGGGTPDLPTGILFAGILSPGVFGAVGGALGTQYARDSSRPANN